jgi:hypothetical protein
VPVVDVTPVFSNQLSMAQIRTEVSKRDGFMVHCLYNGCLHFGCRDVM